MSHEYLKAEYERHPERWVIERYSGMCWVPLQRPSWCHWVPSTHYRLRPVVPGGLPALPDAAYCYGPDKPGAIFAGAWVKKPDPHMPVIGWALVAGSRWAYSTIWSGEGSNKFDPYLIDRTDPNAESIFEMNMPAFTGMDTASDCDYTVIWEKSLMEKLMNTEETDRLIANTAALSGALAQAGGDPETILCKDGVRELLRSLATNNIELRAVYSGKRGES